MHAGIYYYAAWTEGGCLLGCDHEHQTVTEAVGCNASMRHVAGSYVVAVENGVDRALNDTEEAEFQRAPRHQKTDAKRQEAPESEDRVWNGQAVPACPVCGVNHHNWAIHEACGQSSGRGN